MATFFISDAHLGLGTPAQERAKEDRLLDFFSRAARTADALFILGDLFDFWFEYGTVVPKGFYRTLAALDGLTSSGVPVHYLAGNHDFWIGDFFSHELGMILHFEPFEHTLYGRRVFFHHGDGLAQKDLGYRLIKPVLRNRLAIAAYRWLHPDLGVRIARGSSKTSRQYTSSKDFGEEEAMLRHAEKKFAEGVDIVIMGHRHEPLLRKMEHGTYLNLGDWISHNTYGRMDASGIVLEHWNADK